MVHGGRPAQVTRSNPLDILRHLVWCEVDDWIPRVRLIREHGTAQVFRPFDREEGFRRYANWQVPRLLDEFSRLRAADLLDIDQLSLGPTDLAAKGRHPEFGPVTLEQMLATWMTHDLAHLTQVARVLTKDSGRHIGPWRAYFSMLQDGSR